MIGGKCMWKNEDGEGWTDWYAHARQENPRDGNPTLHLGLASKVSFILVRWVQCARWGGGC